MFKTCKGNNFIPTKVIHTFQCLPKVLWQLGEPEVCYHSYLAFCNCLCWAAVWLCWLRLYPPLGSLLCCPHYAILTHSNVWEKVAMLAWECVCLFYTYQICRFSSQDPQGHKPLQYLKLTETDFLEFHPLNIWISEYKVREQINWPSVGFCV